MEKEIRFGKDRSGLGQSPSGHFLKQGVFSSPVMTPANQLGKARPSYATPWRCGRHTSPGRLCLRTMSAASPSPTPSACSGQGGLELALPFIQAPSQAGRLGTYAFFAVTSGCNCTGRKPGVVSLCPPPPTPLQPTFRLSHEARARARQGLGGWGKGLVTCGMWLESRPSGAEEGSSSSRLSPPQRRLLP